MAITATVTGFKGLSSDTKPTTGITPGQIFIETDTNKGYFWDNSTWSSIITSALTEVQYLQGRSALGKLINITGIVVNPGANATIVSYTPANGATFVLFEAMTSITDGTGAMNSTEVRLRNNGVTIGNMVSNQLNNTIYCKFQVKGDQLVGTGALIYDIFNVTGTGSATASMSGSICGYLL